LIFENVDKFEIFKIKTGFSEHHPTKMPKKTQKNKTKIPKNPKISIKNVHKESLKIWII